MYASSSIVHLGCSSGLRYTASHKISHKKPIPPVNKNAHRQPRCSAILGITSGVIIAPTLVPALKIPVASARSFFGNHSATVFKLDGKTPASPKPSAPRAIANVKKEFAAA